MTAHEDYQVFEDHGS